HARGERAARAAPERSRRAALGFRRGGQADAAAARAAQRRQRAGAESALFRVAAPGLGDRVRAGDPVDAAARRRGRGAGAGHRADRSDRRRLHADPARRGRAGIGACRVPGHGTHLHPVGRGRPARHRRRRRRARARRHAFRSALTMDAVIEARGLTKRYGRITAVDAIDLDIRRGEVFGLLGPNGSGKTTTILMLLGLTDVTAGRVRVLGLDPARAPLAVKRRVGYMPDTVGFYDHMSARANLRYTGRLAGIDPAHLEARIDEVLGQVGLTEAAERRTGGFSSGMRRRLGLAEVLLKQPDVAILDEPTNELDPSATREFLELILELKRRGITVLLSSHLLERVQAVCDRVALFHRGRIVLEGTVGALAQQVLG